MAAPTTPAALLTPVSHLAMTIDPARGLTETIAGDECLIDVWTESEAGVDFEHRVSISTKQGDHVIVLAVASESALTLADVIARALEHGEPASWAPFHNPATSKIVRL